MVQYADSHGNERISRVLCLSRNEDSAFASLMYMIAGGEIDTATLPPNQRETLLDMYAKVYRGGHRIDGD